MGTFEITTIVVGAAGIAACFTSYFHPLRALADLGHNGRSWFDHADDAELASRPTEDAVDAPIPRRPLRTRGW